MNNRAARVTLLLLAVAAAGGATYSLVRLERDGTIERARQQGLRDQTGGLLTSISDLRAAQRGYVAAGQGHPFWTAHVTTVRDEVDVRLRELRGSVQSDGAVAAIDAAEVALENFAKLDARAQEYVRRGQQLLASDLIFSDGLEMTGAATGHVASALEQEILAREENSRVVRRQQVVTAAGSSAVLLLVAFLLFPRPFRVEATSADGRAGQVLSQPETSSAARAPRMPLAEVDQDSATVLAGAARLCTEFGRVMDTREVPPLLARAAELLDATGLVVWMSDRTGVELSPVLTHGYPDPIVATLRSLPREAQNAVGLAFRSAHSSVVPSTDRTNGAVVVPLMTPVGCVGVFAAELRPGREQRESIRALATILAAQLATLLSGTPSAGAGAGAAQAQA